MVNYNTKFVTIEILRRKKLELERLYKSEQAKNVSTIQARKLAKQGYLAYFAYTKDVEVKSLSI